MRDGGAVTHLGLPFGVRRGALWKRWGRRITTHTTTFATRPNQGVSRASDPNGNGVDDSGTGGGVLFVVDREEG